ncbi:Nucleolar protein,Nop52 containing protein [Brugia malayi]|uniref:Bm2820 n=2 Tax=Brugia malayi TaxID=6279 RepID=A0A0I9N4F2_BRUMA|nr:Nucleolar protein,Nop52 containing protein [Brugia malayi]CTP80855.1 Bm2820 [Brugia malayi]VIO97962.1 Nucleolar protein,Nop52 containing protein [Brugia malayi]
MDSELDEVEIVFAQKLASGEPIIRRRAFRTLCDWIRTESAKREFDYKAMSHLTKGLHYAMWMQDKMLWQEQLADNIASLINLFEREKESVSFIKSMLVTISNEWPRIDRWRMDKFLMLIRRLVRALFHRLRSKDWKTTITDMYISAFKDCVISNDKSFSEGLKFHFASVYLDELDGAGGLGRDQVTELLKPYAELLGDGKISNYLFDSIIQEIFLSILHQYAEDKVGKNGADELATESASDQGIKFDYAEISQLLLEIGKKPGVKSARRKRLYDVSKKFKAVENGEIPFVMVTKAQTRLRTDIPKSEIVSAVSRLMNEVEKDKLMNKKAKLALKKKASLRSASQPTKVLRSTKKTKIDKKMRHRSGVIRKKRKQQKL